MIQCHVETDLHISLYCLFAQDDMQAAYLCRISHFLNIRLKELFGATVTSLLGITKFTCIVVDIVVYMSFNYSIIIKILTSCDSVIVVSKTDHFTYNTLDVLRVGGWVWQ